MATDKNSCKCAAIASVVLLIMGSAAWAQGYGNITVTTATRVTINFGGPVPSTKYLCFEPIRLDANADFDTEDLYTKIQMFKWRNVNDSILFLGALAIAPICGALTWRPHIWVHAPAGTGKTTLYTLAKHVCSPLALCCDGGSSEAGIRQTLGPDSLAVLMDEFEGDQHMLKGVLRLARTASSADDPLLRGSPEGKALGFALRTMFLWFSINPLGMSVADETRTVMLELDRHDGDSTKAQEIESAIITSRNKPGQWCAYMVNRARLVLDAINQFEQVINGDRRHRLNMATLLGGAYVALKSEVPDKNTAEEWAQPYVATIKQHAEEQERDDAQECLDYLLSHIIRRHTYPDNPLGHWIATAYQHQKGNEAVRDEDGKTAKAILAANDMILRDPGLLIKNRSAAIERIFAGSPWADRGWQRAIRKLDGVQPLRKTVKNQRTRRQGNRRSAEILRFNVRRR